MQRQHPLTVGSDNVADPPAEGPVQPAPLAASLDIQQIFKDYAPFIWRTLRHMGVRDSDVPDVCQEVFLAVHRKLEGFEGRSSLRTWLYGICMRVASDHRRRAYMRRELPVSEPPARREEATQHDDYQRGQARQLLLRILDELDDDKRAVFVLYEIEEMPMKDVAEALGCPLQTAYSRLHAARKQVLEAGKRLSAEGT
ncbi:MAG TPA: sigma-70 family RNA polymerase sigma factor [Polyangiaceae bacterium]|nr:sigma-70 family RNA polymerase sigma factor [Polyangiaceae bacterium]